mgnify:CR=1 FL=1
MTAITFLNEVLPVISSNTSCLTSVLDAWGVLMVVSFFGLGLLVSVADNRPIPVLPPEPKPKPKKLSPRARRRARRQRNADGSKRRWRKGQRAPR